MPYKIILFAVCAIACSQPTAEKEVAFDSYKSLKTHTEKYRDSLKIEYKSANTNRKKAIISTARDSLLGLIVSEYFGFWKGTKWSFSGTTQEPKKGTIACGYFVTTVLQDAQFKIPRVRWAQAASETMIKNMTNDIKRFSNATIESVEEYIKNKGEGLYIVGLDNHTGFIINFNNKIRFVHSNYY